jgi:hypothetical protein
VSVFQSGHSVNNVPLARIFSRGVGVLVDKLAAAKWYSDLLPLLNDEEIQ